jgi:molybdopterin-guanine dinucleotide biosynthesis adapter protein
MKIYGVIGWKNAGKTSLMERLVAEITGRGLSVSTVKHVHHDVDLDQPGKDTFRHRAAGAREVVLASAKRHAILTEHRDGGEPDLGSLLLRLAPVDLVLVEGYKRDAHPKVEVFRAETGQALIQPGDPLVRAVATDAALGALPVPVLDLNDTGAVADFILRETGLMPDPVAASTRQFPDTTAAIDTTAVFDPAAAFDTVGRLLALCRRAVGGCDLDRRRAGGRGRCAVSPHAGRGRGGAYSPVRRGTSAGRRVLAGFDFPLGYPAGFAQRLTGQPGARSVWRWLEAHHCEGPDNRNTRFVLANAINAGFGRAGPFWGRPRGLALAHLPETEGGGLRHPWPGRTAARGTGCAARAAGVEALHHRIGGRAGADRPADDRAAGGAPRHRRLAVRAVGAGAGAGRGLSLAA